MIWAVLVQSWTNCLASQLLLAAAGQNSFNLCQQGRAINMDALMLLSITARHNAGFTTTHFLISQT